MGVSWQFLAQWPFYPQRLQRLPNLVVSSGNKKSFLWLWLLLFETSYKPLIAETTISKPVLIYYSSFINLWSVLNWCACTFCVIVSVDYFRKASVSRAELSKVFLINFVSMSSLATLCSMLETIFSYFYLYLCLYLYAILVTNSKSLSLSSSSLSDRILFLPRVLRACFICTGWY